MAVNGIALGVLAAGGILIYSGLTGKGVLTSLKYVVQGNSPATVPVTEAIAGTSSATSTTTAPGSTVPNSSNSSGMAALKAAAATKGWDTGAEWTALDAIENQEAGYDPTNTNPSSHAYGLAQSLGHPFAGGPASNGINEYGGYGLSPGQSEQASLGNATYQAVWMVNYIASRYGDAIAAEKFHLANNWY